MKYLFFLLLPFVSAAQYNQAYLKSEADTIRLETARGANTAQRVGRMFVNLNKNLVNGSMITTTGSSGPATFNYSTGVLNIPNYGGGITNSASNTELMMSDGTNAISSQLFASTISTSRTLQIGSSGGSTVRGRITTDGNASNIPLEIFPKGTGEVGINGINGGVTLSIGANVSHTYVLDVKDNSGNSLLRVARASGEIAFNNSVGTVGQVFTSAGSGAAPVFTDNIKTITNGVELKQILQLLPVTTSFSSNQNDYDVGSGAMIDMSTDDTVTRQLTGLANGIAGRLLIIRNMNTTAVIAFNNEDSGSSAANRIHSSTGSTLNLNPGKVLMLTYKTGSLNRWVDISF